MMKRIGQWMFLVLALSIFCAGAPGDCQEAKDDSRVSEKLNELDAKELNAILNELIDAKIRQARIPEKGPGQAAGKESPKKLIVRYFLEGEESVTFLYSRMGALLEETAAAPERIGAALSMLTEGKGASHLFKMFLWLGVLIGLGFLVEGGLRRAAADTKRKILADAPSGVVDKTKRILLNFSIELFCTGGYVLATFMLFTMFFNKGTQTFLFAALYLVVSYYVRTAMLLVNLILAPGAPMLRIAPMEDAVARYLQRWLITLAVIGAFTIATGVLFRLMDGVNEFPMVVYSLGGFIVLFLIICMIWQSRKTVAGIIRERYLSKMEEITPVQEKLADIWHIPAIFYVLCIGVFLEIGILTMVEDLVNRLTYSFLIIPVFLGLDALGRRLLSITFEPTVISFDKEEETGESDEAKKEGEDGEPGAGEMEPWEKKLGVDRYVPMIRRMYLVLLAAVSFFLLLKIWGVGWSVGAAFSRAAISIMITGVLSYVGWEYLSAIIDRKLKEEMPDDDEEMEEGGAGGSRIGTLLLLLKKAILVIIVVMVTLIVLSAMGVNIGPLIAGAGVFGLAVGFGAQTLVKDILAGVFFLIDDAFRVGDYIEAGSQKGTVEQISLRALRLRHHRGPVITIPFGDLSSVKNLSRDYVIQKLKFRVPYDTDVDKVRKIVKKIYKEIRKDEEMGPNLLGKIKSQGVKELDDSAMIMRVKFKCIPGEQFLIQREVLRRMQERFKAAGLRFAHRNVTVYLPREEKEEALGVSDSPKKPPPPLSPDEEKRELAAAAAGVLLGQEAEEQANKEK